MSFGRRSFATATLGLTRRFNASVALGRADTLPAWVTVLVVGLVILIVRRPESLLRAEFWAEDGRLFLDAATHGFQPLLDPVAGYVLLAPRLIALFELVVPLPFAPSVGNLAALVIAACVGAFVASDRLAGAIPDRRLRFVLGLSVALLPGSEEVFGTAVNTQWVLGLWLAIVLIADPVRSRIGVLGESLAIAVAGLTGPFSILLLPLFLLARNVRRAAIVSATAVVQALTLLGSPRSAQFEDAAAWPAVILSRVFAQPFLGFEGLSSFHETAWWIGPALGVATLTALGLVASALPRRPVLMASAAMVAIIAGTIVGLQFSAGILLVPGAGLRYFWIPGALITGLTLGALAAARDWRRGLAAILAGSIVVAMVIDFRLEPRPDMGWPETSECLTTGARPCEVPIAPPGYSLALP